MYGDGKYDYNIGDPPSVYLLKNRRSDYKELGAKDERRKKAREKERKEITVAELEELAREIIPRLNTDDLEKAKKILLGTIRSFNEFKVI